MLGKDLPAYVPTTALALLALHDRPTEAAVARSVAFLHGRRLAETGALALALARIALGVYGAEAEDVNAAIAGEWQRLDVPGESSRDGAWHFARSPASDRDSRRSVSEITRRDMLKALPAAAVAAATACRQTSPPP